MKRIPLQNSTDVAIVDDMDYERVMQHRWFVYSDGRHLRYVRSHMAGSFIYLHRFIANAPPGLEIDHRNHDTLDNRRANVRVCTPRINNLNRRSWGRSGFRGVYKNGNHRWLAQISHHGVLIYLGRFDNPEAAARAFDAKAIQLRGNDTRLNFPEEPQS